MVKNIRVMTASYKNIHLGSYEAKNVRGFFADLDQQDSCLHNHTSEGKDIYRYPLIQYKVLKGTPVVVAAEDGIRSIHPHLMTQTELSIGKNIYRDTALDIKLSARPLGDRKTEASYRFLTPWLALNQENYKIYLGLGDGERDELLSRILIGNILSLCKAFDIQIEGQLKASHKLKSAEVWYKQKKMMGFTGEFKINCYIPEMLGIGKGTARGFGTVGLAKEQKETAE